MRISFEVSKPEADGRVEIQLYLDRIGRDFLVKELGRLEFPDNDHFHMLSPAWGSDELTEERRNANASMGGHLKVYIRPDDESLFDADGDVTPPAPHPRR
ncbi:MAG: hypothetical protein ACRC9K_03275 [Afipia sp.]